MCMDTLYGRRLNDERLYKPTLQRVKMESVFHELYHTITRKRKCAGISVIISLSRATNETVFFFFHCEIGSNKLVSF